MLDNDPAHWSLIVTLERRVRQTPDARFLFERDGVGLSFAQVHGLAAVAADDLRRQGVRANDRVVIFSGDSLATTVAWFAVAMLGAIEVPIHPGLVGEPLLHVLRKVDPVLVSADADLVPLAAGALATLSISAACRPLADPRQLGIASADIRPVVRYGGDAASLLFTSGTSGPPKAAIVTEAQALLTGRLMVENLAIGPDDIFYCAHPMYHMAAKHCVILAAIQSGAAVCLDHRFDAATWLDKIRHSGATVTIGHGPMLEMIYDQPGRADDAETQLRALITSPFPRRIAADFERRFGLRGIEVWGMTELGIPCWSDLNAPLQPGTCGRASSPWFDIILRNEAGREVPDGELGELTVTPLVPELVSPGYWGEAPRPDGPFRTGDLGRRIDGLLGFVDRATHRIRRRAENISASQIEDAALLHPAIAECAAIGVPSGYEGDDDIKLFVAIRPGMLCPEPELLRHLAQHVPHYMVPRYIVIIDRLPRTPTQKVRRDVLVSSVDKAWDRRASGIRLRALRDRV